MATRKDSRGYALKKGESQRKDGRYVFRYTTIRGEHRAVYAKDLSELRKKEVKIRRAIEDGLDPDRAERITLNELFDEYISQKYDLKQSTLTNYKYMYNHYVRESFGKLRIKLLRHRAPDIADLALLRFLLLVKLWNHRPLVFLRNSESCFLQFPANTHPCH